MELKLVIDLTDEVKEFLKSLITGEAADAPAAKSSRKATTKEVVEDAPDLTELRAKAKKYGDASEANKTKFKALLAKYDVKNIPSLSAEQVEEFEADLDTLIKKKK